MPEPTAPSPGLFAMTAVPDPAAAAGPAGPAPRGLTLTRSLAELPILAGLAVAIVVVVRVLLVQAFYIPTGSMLPQLQLQDKVVVSRMAYHLHSPRRGDIVVFNAPASARSLEGAPPHGGSAGRRAVRFVAQKLGLAATSDVFIKRVIALPGETVEGHDGHVYINGRLLMEPYLPAGLQTETFPPTPVPGGHLWVMGDNRNNSADSHVFGPISAHSLIGRAVLRVWPVTHLSFL